MAAAHSPYDLIVVGQGPAGVSAAIYAVRAGLSVLLIGRDKGSLEKAEKIENYFGFVEPISGIDLLARGLTQASRLGVEILDAEVTSVIWLDQFEAVTTRGSFKSSCMVLALGMPRRKAAIPGLCDFEGRGVSYCATCDGFFYRGKKVAVIGNGEYAYKEACELKPFAAQITLLTNGRDFEATGHDPAFQLNLGKILRAEGDEEKIRRLVLEDGTLEIDGVFIAEGTATALDLALKLGLENDGKVILVDENQQTNLPGLFAAGDCTGGLLQVAVAVGEGARAGMAATGFVRKLKGGKEPTVQWGSGNTVTRSITEN
jgi:thioredoxin reductase (NADPH)